jgi:hypothetical protein
MFKSKTTIQTSAVALITLAMTGVVFAKDAKRPDLTGIWTNASLTNLTRPRGVDKLVLTAEEAEILAANTAVAGISPEEADDSGITDPNEGAPPKGSRDFGLRGYNSFWVDPGTSLARVKGELRSSYIIDPANGQIPRLPKPKIDYGDRGFGARYLTGIGGNSDPEALPLAERCLIGFGNTGGPGMQGVLYNSNYQFVHTDEYLMIMVEMVHDVRVIPIFDSAKAARANHRPEAIKPWLGDSVGWYEGKTLVVETTNYKPLQIEQGSIKITEDGKLTERFTRHSETEVVYQFTVEDPNFYSQPWTAELSFHATDESIFEYACHEGNYAMEGILAGARLKETQETGKK